MHLKKSHRNNAKNKKTKLTKKTAILSNLKKYPNKITSFFLPKHPKNNNTKKNTSVKKNTQRTNIKKTHKKHLFGILYIYKKKKQKNTKNN